MQQQKAASVRAEGYSVRFLDIAPRLSGYPKSAVSPRAEFTVTHYPTVPGLRQFTASDAEMLRKLQRII